MMEVRRHVKDREKKKERCDVPGLFFFFFVCGVVPMVPINQYQQYVVYSSLSTLPIAHPSIVILVVQ